MKSIKEDGFLDNNDIIDYKVFKVPDVYPIFKKDYYENLNEVNIFLKKIETDFNIKSALIIGFFQVIALIPGASRAGITITAGRILGFNRVDSTKISFYLSIPALIGASALGIKDLFKENIEFNFLVLIGIILSFFFSLITIKFFLNFIKTFSFNVFVVYRIFLALIIFYIIYF